MLLCSFIVALISPYSLQPYKLCAFQSANYRVSIAKNGRSVASARGSFSGGRQQKKIMQIPFSDQNVQAEHTAHVSITSQYGSEQASVKCYLEGMCSCMHEVTYCMVIFYYCLIDSSSVPSIGGLDGASASESGTVHIISRIFGKCLIGKWLLLGIGVIFNFYLEIFIHQNLATVKLSM